MATVRVRSELRVLETDMVTLIHVIVVGAGVCSFQGAAVVVESAMLTALAWVGFVRVHRSLGSASELVRSKRLVLEANALCGRHFVAVATGGRPGQRATSAISFSARKAFSRISVVRTSSGIGVVLAVRSAAGPSVLWAIFFTAVLLHALGESVGAESLPDDTATIVVHLIFRVLAASRSNTLLFIGRTTGDRTARVLQPCLALVLFRVACHLRRVPSRTGERLSVAGPTVVAALAIGAGAFSGGTTGRGGTAYVLFPRLALIRSGLAGHLRDKAVCASERLPVAGPTVVAALAIGAGAFVGGAADALAGAACVLVPGLALIGSAFARHLRGVAATACVRLSVACPTIVVAVGPGAGALGGRASSVISGRSPRGRCAEIIVGGKLLIFEACVARRLHSVARSTRFVPLEGAAVVIVVPIFDTLGWVVSCWGGGGVASVIIGRVLLPLVGALPTDG